MTFEDQSKHILKLGFEIIPKTKHQGCGDECHGKFIFLVEDGRDLKKPLLDHIYQKTGLVYRQILKCDHCNTLYLDDSEQDDQHDPDPDYHRNMVTVLAKKKHPESAYVPGEPNWRED